MEPLERAARRLGIEGARRDLVGHEIVEQRARDGGLADPALVRTHENDCWLGHGAVLRISCSITACLGRSHGANMTEIPCARLSTEGCVANTSAKPWRGLSMHISITAELARSISPRPSILRSAVIMASGFLVSSTEPASARYSRWRDSARRMTTDRIQATT